MNEAEVMVPEFPHLLDLIPDIVLTDVLDHIIQGKEQTLGLQCSTGNGLAVGKLRR